MKPKVFIGSSVEGLSVAYAIQQNLTHDTEPTVWDQGVFELSKTTIESLSTVMDTSDFGIFVFSPDDITKIRDKVNPTIRDNVIFEFGLFIGRLSRERVFFVIPDGSDFHLPTDLLGITPGKYNPHREDGSLQAATGPACNQIRQSIKNLPLLRQQQVHNESVEPETQSNMSDNDWLNDLVERDLATAKQKLLSILPSKSGDDLLEHKAWLAYIELKENAVTGLQSLLSIADANQSSLYTQTIISRFLIWENYCSDAQNIIDRALIINPKNPELLILKSSCLKNIGQQTEAITTLSSNSFSENPEIAIALAGIYEEQGEPEKAKDCLRLAYSRYPSNQGVAHKYARALQLNNQNKEALYILNHLTIEHPKSALYWGTLSNTCLQLHLFDKALSTCRKAIELTSEKESWLLNNAGNILSNRGLYSDAIELLQKGLALDPASDYAHSRLAESFINKSKENTNYNEICKEGRILLHTQNTTVEQVNLPNQ